VTAESDCPEPRWTGIAQQIREACGAIQECLRRRGRRQNGPPPHLLPGQNRKAWLEAWVGGPIDRWNELEKPKVLQDWKKRWEAHNRRIGRQEPSGASRGRDRYVPEDTEPTTRVLALHKHLRKVESSVLVQARTGEIGFAKFLCDRRVPGYATGQCLCGHGLETP
jgi:CelD/BcsL family acetyltransferase involved in cellulose biosynthesis